MTINKCPDYEGTVSLFSSVKFHCILTSVKLQLHYCRIIVVARKVIAC